MKEISSSELLRALSALQIDLFLGITSRSFEAASSRYFCSVGTLSWTQEQLHETVSSDELSSVVLLPSFRIRR